MATWQERFGWSPIPGVDEHVPSLPAKDLTLNDWRTFLNIDVPNAKERKSQKYEHDYDLIIKQIKRLCQAYEFDSALGSKERTLDSLKVEQAVTALRGLEGTEMGPIGKKQAFRLHGWDDASGTRLAQKPHHFDYCLISFYGKMFQQVAKTMRKSKDKTSPSPNTPDRLGRSRTKDQDEQPRDVRAKTPSRNSSSGSTTQGIRKRLRDQSIVSRRSSSVDLPSQKQHILTYGMAMCDVVDKPQLQSLNIRVEKNGRLAYLTVADICSDPFNLTKSDVKLDAVHKFLTDNAEALEIDFNPDSDTLYYEEPGPMSTQLPVRSEREFQYVLNSHMNTRVNAIFLTAKPNVITRTKEVNFGTKRAHSSDKSATDSIESPYKKIKSITDKMQHQMTRRELAELLNKISNELYSASPDIPMPVHGTTESPDPNAGSVTSADAAQATDPQNWRGNSPIEDLSQHSNSDIPMPLDDTTESPDPNADSITPADAAQATDPQNWRGNSPIEDLSQHSNSDIPMPLDDTTESPDPNADSMIPADAAQATDPQNSRGNSPVEDLSQHASPAGEPGVDDLDGSTGEDGGGLAAFCDVDATLEDLEEPHIHDILQSGDPKKFADRLWRLKFPHGSRVVSTPATGLLCGLHALRQSVECQIRQIVPPKIGDLRTILYSRWFKSIPSLRGEETSGELSNLSIDSISHILKRWYQYSAHEQIALGYIWKDIKVIVTKVQDESSIVWLHNDAAEDTIEFNPTADLTILNHWSALDALSLEYTAPAEYPRTTLIPVINRSVERDEKSLAWINIKSKVRHEAYCYPRCQMGFGNESTDEDEMINLDLISRPLSGTEVEHFDMSTYHLACELGGFDPEQKSSFGALFLPCKPDKPIYIYQWYGVVYLLQMGNTVRSGYILADQTGFGKTWEICGVFLTQMLVNVAYQRLEKDMVELGKDTEKFKERHTPSKETGRCICIDVSDRRRLPCCPNDDQGPIKALGIRPRKGAYLVIVPGRLILNWLREVCGFFKDHKTRPPILIAYQRSKELTKAIETSYNTYYLPSVANNLSSTHQANKTGAWFQRIGQRILEERITDPFKVPIVITSFGCLNNYVLEWLDSKPGKPTIFSFVTVDEFHENKAPDTGLNSILIPLKGHNGELIRYYLSATPIETSVKDIVGPLQAMVGEYTQLTKNKTVALSPLGRTLSQADQQLVKLLSPIQFDFIGHRCEKVLGRVKQHGSEYLSEHIEDADELLQLKSELWKRVPDILLQRTASSTWLDGNFTVKLPPNIHFDITVKVNQIKKPHIRSRLSEICKAVNENAAAELTELQLEWKEKYDELLKSVHTVAGRRAFNKHWDKMPNTWKKTGNSKGAWKMNAQRARICCELPFFLDDRFEGLDLDAPFGQDILNNGPNKWVLDHLDEFYDNSPKLQALAHAAIQMKAMTDYQGRREKGLVFCWHPLPMVIMNEYFNKKLRIKSELVHSGQPIGDRSRIIDEFRSNVNVEMKPIAEKDRVWFLFGSMDILGTGFTIEIIKRSFLIGPAYVRRLEIQSIGRGSRTVLVQLNPVTWSYRILIEDSDVESTLLLIQDQRTGVQEAAYRLAGTDDPAIEFQRRMKEERQQKGTRNQPVII